MQDNHKICFLAVAALAALFAFYPTGQQHGPEMSTRAGEEKFIRLHVVANSDNPADQELKLKVKDAVSAFLENNLAAVQNTEEARRVVYQNLSVLEEVARAEAAAAGQDYEVKAEMGTFSFPHKNYGSFILPAGDYEAVRVVIGSGRGANWWCVLFPPLCFITASGNADTASRTNTGETAQALGAGVTVEPRAGGVEAPGPRGVCGYEFRFRSWELIEQLKNNWSSKDKNECCGGV